MTTNILSQQNTSGNGQLKKIAIVRTNTLTTVTRTFIPRGLIGRVIDTHPQTGNLIIDFGFRTSVVSLPPDNPLIRVLDLDVESLRIDVNRLADEITELDKKLADLGQRMEGAK